MCFKTSIKRVQSLYIKVHSLKLDAIAGSPDQIQPQNNYQLFFGTKLRGHTFKTNAYQNLPRGRADKEKITAIENIAHAYLMARQETMARGPEVNFNCVTPIVH